MMAAATAENSHPTASIPALGFGLRVWCKSGIETSHAAASPSINKIARFFFDSSPNCSGRSAHWVKVKNPKASRREA
jgi:hypothetical protein